MNFKPFVLTLALLVCPALLAQRECSVASPMATQEEIYDALIMDCNARFVDTNAVTNDLLVFFLADQIEHKYPAFDCKFKPYARVKRTVLKDLFNRYFLNDSLNFSVAVDSFGEFNVITNDQAMEVGWAAVDAAVNHKAAAQAVAKAALYKYISEKLVDVLKWAADATNVENLLPDLITQNAFYQPARTELGRYAVDEYILPHLR